MAIFAIFGRKIWEAACPIFIFAKTVVQKGLHYGNLSFAPCPISILQAIEYFISKIISSGKGDFGSLGSETKHVYV